MSNRFEQIFLKCLKENTVVSALGDGARMDGAFSGGDVWNSGDQRLANFIGTKSFIGDDVSKKGKSKKKKRKSKKKKKSKKSEKTKKESAALPIQRRSLHNSM